MAVDEAMPVGFSLTEGGPFHRLLVALGARSHGGWGLVRVAVLLGLVTWVPLLVASVAEDLALGWPGAFGRDVGAHARFLAALPLAVWAERPIARRLDRALRYLTSAGLIHDANRAASVAAIRRAERMRDHFAPELLLAVCAVALSYVDLHGHAHGTRTWSFPTEGASVSGAGWLYLLGSVPLFRFIALRWAWRFVIWSVLLAGLARSRLRIDPAHPDGDGGLSVLFGSHTSFGWLALASGVSLAGTLWTEKLLTGLSVMAYRTEILAFSIGAPLVLLLPLFAFSWPLEEARRRYHEEYGSAAADFAFRYAGHWIHERTRQPLPLGTGETSAHADLVTSFARVESTHWVPFTKADYFTLFCAASTPMIVFTLQEIPLLDLLHRIKDTIG